MKRQILIEDINKYIKIYYLNKEFDNINSFESKKFRNNSFSSNARITFKFHTIPSRLKSRFYTKFGSDTNAYSLITEEEIRDFLNKNIK
jgi:hypothetical protein